MEEEIVENIEEQVLEDDITYQLHTGIELSLDDVYQISSMEMSKLIIFAGSVGCGKTTLLTSIYQQFLIGENTNYCFMGSETLFAFEERAHNTRIQSNQSNPTTPRTPRGVLDEYLHLKLFDNRSKAIKNLFISDFSGEDFERLNGAVEDAKEEISIVKQAKLLCIILDGEKLSSSQYLHRELNKAQTLLRTIKDADLLQKSTKVLVIISKFDLVISAYNDREHEIEQIVNEIKKQITSQLQENKYEICKVAALPPQSTEMVPAGLGVNAIIDILFEHNNIASNHINQSTNLLYDNSQFNLFERSVAGE